MPDRRILWGADATDAQYRTGDTDGDTNFVVAEDTDAGTVLLEWDDTANEWVSRGPVNMSSNDITNAGAVTASSIDTEQVGNGRHYAAAYNGGDLDTRLDNAIAAAATDDIIMLEKGDYGDNRTISGGYDLYGYRNTTSIEGEWTFDNNQPTVAGVQVAGANGGRITLATANCTITRCRLAGSGSLRPLQDNAGDNLIFGVDGGTVGGEIQFASGTSGSVVDAARNISVIDNGSNNQGDVF